MPKLLTVGLAVLAVLAVAAMAQATTPVPPPPPGYEFDIIDKLRQRERDVWFDSWPLWRDSRWRFPEPPLPPYPCPVYICRPPIEPLK